MTKYTLAWIMAVARLTSLTERLDSAICVSGVIEFINEMGQPRSRSVHGAKTKPAAETATGLQK
ncbi:hypothetical protein [Rhodopila sp.]|uniref:hypothetical protein n=1 Tax=Rhodopila sp. TaxID=2480087 RepID=UPI003D0A93C0